MTTLFSSHIHVHYRIWYFETLTTSSDALHDSPSQNLGGRYPPQTPGLALMCVTIYERAYACVSVCIFQRACVRVCVCACVRVCVCVYVCLITEYLRIRWYPWLAVLWLRRFQSLEHWRSSDSRERSTARRVSPTKNDNNHVEPTGNKKKRRLTHALLCWTLQIQWIPRNLQSLTWKNKNSDLKIKNLKTYIFRIFRFLSKSGFYYYIITGIFSRYINSCYTDRWTSELITSKYLFKICT